MGLVEVNATVNPRKLRSAIQNLVKSTVDGVIGVVTHRVPRAVVLEAKQRHVRALIPLERVVDTTAPDHRLIQEAVTETHVLSHINFIRDALKELLAVMGSIVEIVMSVHNVRSQNVRHTQKVT